MRKVVLMILALVAGVQADRAFASDRTSKALARILHFPRDRYAGNLYAEDPCLGSTAMELGRDLSLPYGLNPVQVGLAGDWDFVGFAQGDVRVPVGRNIQMIITLRPKKEDAAKLATLLPRQYKMCVADCCREGPLDVSGLSDLEPNDLYFLTVYSLVRRADADRSVLEPIRHLTGLKILRLYGTGITDKGMEYIRELRSLRALEVLRAADRKSRLGRAQGLAPFGVPGP